MTHALYVAAAYGISAVILCGLVLWLFMDGRMRQRELAELDAAGTRRRSER